jgi:hypothetical protein
MTTNGDWSFTVLALGGAEHVREQCIPLAEALVEASTHQGTPEHHKLPESPMFLSERPRATATLGLAESLVGIIVFLSGWGAKRLLDDVYEFKLRPHVRRILGEPGTQQASCRPASAFVLSLWHDAHARGVVVVAIGSSRVGLLDSEARVRDVQLHAEQFVASIAAESPIALYPVIDGVPHQPHFFANVGIAYEFIVTTSWKPGDDTRLHLGALNRRGG